MNNLRRIRIQHQVRQAELAKRVEVTRQCMLIAELQGALSPKLALKVAEELGENPFDILGTDVFRLMPKTKADIDSIRRLLDTLEQKGEN